MKIRGVVGAIIGLAAAVMLFSHRQAAGPGGGLGSSITQVQAVNLSNQQRPEHALSTGSASIQKQAIASPAPTNFVTNPYAAALKQVGTSFRDWDPGFIDQFSRSAEGTPVRFALTDGKTAVGTLRIRQFRDEKLTYMSGELTEPETGKFFILTPPEGSKAGLAAGVIEFWGSKTAYRIEPTGRDGSPQLWRRQLDEVICLTMPLMDHQAPEHGNEHPAPQTAEDSPTAMPVVDPSVYPPGTTPEPAPPLRPDLVPDFFPSYNSNIISLQSYPGSKAVMLLDFFGGYTPTWGGVSYPPAGVNNTDIKDLWKRVAEDYMPFNINVTTDIQVYQNAPANSRQKCVFTPSTSAMPAGAAGVAYIGSWDWGSDTVCWSIYTSGKSGGEVGSHEVGHTVGLGHQGTSATGYYSGHGSGVTGWGPIMGAGYYQNVITWAKGEYLDANNKEDELNIIVTQNNNVTYRIDDTGSTYALARYLEIYSNNTVFAEGDIERTGDSDAFRFQTGGGVVSITASPVGTWANLAITLSLTDSNDVAVATSNPTTTLSAVLTRTVAAGSYALKVTGAGRLNMLTNGFSSYGSLGYYSMSGTVAGARQPTRFSIPEHLPAGTIVGPIPASSPADPLDYAIISGNTGGTFTIDTNGILAVADGTYLDYNRLASNTMFTVQFELFVNITNLANPDLTELNRRVVVGITNINDTPVVTSVTNGVIEGTRIGTVIGKIGATDLDGNQTLSFSIADGNDGTFSLDSTGILRLVQPVSTTNQTQYTLQVVATDSGSIPLSGTGYVTINIITNTTPFAPGLATFATYESIGSGMLVVNMTTNSHWPRDADLELPLTSFETPANRADNYGGAVRTCLIVPISGSYRFWIASDDNSELWFSGSTNGAGISRIAYISGSTGYTGQREWTKFATQRSGAIYLTAGQGYYIEARMKEGGGSDHLSVAWSGPATDNQTNVIPGMYLTPAPYNYRPQIASLATGVSLDAFEGSAIAKLKVTDLNPGDTQSFTIAGGTAAAFCGIQPTTGLIYVKSEAELRARTAGAYTLYVSVTDSGIPALTATSQIAVSILNPGAIAAGIRQEIWTNILSGTAVADLTNNLAFPGRPNLQVTLTNLAAGTNFTDSYGSRIRGLITPPQSGDYTFFIASDDSSALLLSPNDQSAGAARIAYVSGSTAYGVWTAQVSQTSPALPLTAGNRYYLEVVHKEGIGNDHLEVAWAGPGLTGTNIIPATALTPVDLNSPPLVTNQTFHIASASMNGTVVGKIQAADGSMDFLAFKLLTNPSNSFLLDPLSGELTLVDASLLGGMPGATAELRVAVQDSGCGGLYPRETSEATITVMILDTLSPVVWTGLGETNLWSIAANWETDPPSPGSGIVFGGEAQKTNSNDQLALASWIQLTNSDLALDVGELTLLNGLTNNGSNVIQGSIHVAESQTWNIASGTLAVAGPITNSGVSLGIAAGGDVALNGTLLGVGLITKGGSSRLLMNGAHPFKGFLTLASAGLTSALEVNGPDDLQMPDTDFVLNGRMDLWNHNATIGSLSGSGMVFGNDGSRFLTVGESGRSGSFSGTLMNSTWAAGATLGLIKAGSGILTLSGGSGFSGGTTIRAGQISIGNNSALGSGPVDLGDLQTGSSDVRLLQATPITCGNTINVTTNGTGQASLGTANLVTSSANAIFSGQINLSRNLTLSAGSSLRTSFSGRITGTGGLRISSPYFPGRRVVLDRPSGIANDFVGDIEILTGSVLQIGATNSIGNRTIPNGSAIRFNPLSTFRIAPTGSGDAESVGSLQSVSPGAGAITMVSGTTFTLTLGLDNADGVYSGGIYNSTGTLAVAKSGTGRQVLAGSNSFSGLLTVNGGTLVAAHSNAMGTATSATYVNSGGSVGLSNNTTIATEPVFMNGTGPDGNGALRNIAGSNAWNGLLSLNGAATISADEGRLWLGGNWNTAGQTVTLRSQGGLIVVVNAIGGMGGLTKSGSGTAILRGLNSYAGTTTVSQGTLCIAANSIVSGSNIVVESAGILDFSSLSGGWVQGANQKLSGDGKVQGNLRMGGLLAPGMGIGAITIQGDCLLTGTTALEINKANPIRTNDAILCTGTLTTGGALTVTNIGVDGLSLGDSFKLLEFGAIIPTEFASIELPVLPSTLKWDTTRLLVDGTITVVMSEVPPPPTLQVLTTHDAITLSWSVDYSDFILEGQTNTLAEGFGINWYPVEGVTNNSVTLPLDPANGAVLFRLSKP